MSVNKIDRRESSVEFDNNYYRIYSDAGKIIDNYFGIKKPLSDMQLARLRTATERIMRVVFDIGTYIRIANSIYPYCLEEKFQRRTAQDKAIGLCFDLLTKYQNIFHEFEVPETKYVDEIKNIRHEINCLKKWRDSDKNRFYNG